MHLLVEDEDAERVGALAEHVHLRQLLRPIDRHCELADGRSVAEVTQPELCRRETDPQGRSLSTRRGTERQR